MTTNITDPEIDARKRAAVAELREHQDRKRRDREARKAASMSADEEIARAIRARRAEEVRIAQVRAGLARALEQNEAAVAAAREDDRKKQEAGNPHLRMADPPARRVAKLLRQHLGDKFHALVREISSVDWESLKDEIRRIPIDEAAEAKFAAEQAMAARLADVAHTLPTPEDEHEAEILRKYGFGGERRQTA